MYRAIIMSTIDIQKKAKYINTFDGKHTEVILPFEVFEELLALKTSMEIFKREETQHSIKKAQKNIVDKKTRSFTKAGDAIRWLKK